MKEVWETEMKPLKLLSQREPEFRAMNSVCEQVRASSGLSKSGLWGWLDPTDRAEKPSPSK